MNHLHIGTPHEDTGLSSLETCPALPREMGWRHRTARRRNGIYHHLASVHLENCSSNTNFSPPRRKRRLR
ncbi:hypothetical protein BDY21DRAFT_335147 [Lineolata rhizophorae]|uniref:Uncharacterized protein n=1 Tax=Lineolata rhizophorae TaxID=578093 RepID=A0A6A6P903_9PEZI|nr:hypothetical protein BDY21DRAFT_335147 [Lineolata rhizophorae]